MKLYSVTYDCPRCGQIHQVRGGGAGCRLVIAQGPDHAGTVAELWPRGNYPPAVAQVLRDLVWCDEGERWVDLDPARVVVRPPGA